MGKGSSPRPFEVSMDQFASNWDAIFKKGVKNVFQSETENPAATSGETVAQEEWNDNGGNRQSPALNNPNTPSQ